MSVRRIPLDQEAEALGEPRIADARPERGDEELDRSLRPQRLTDFVSQRQVTDQLAIFIEAARKRGEPLDHVLLAGPPGLGKTSLAHIIAAELGVPLVGTAGPALERKADVASFLTTLEPGSVFFVDEIHRLNRAIEETLYPAMEDSQLPVVLGQGPGRPHGDARPAALHPGRRDDPGRPALDAAARPLRRQPPARALRPGRPRRDRRALRRHPRDRDRAGGDGRDRDPLARHAPGRKPAPEAGSRLRRRARQRRRSRPRSRPRRWRCSRSTRPVSTAPTARS